MTYLAFTLALALALLFLCFEAAGRSYRTLIISAIAFVFSMAFVYVMMQ